MGAAHARTHAVLSFDSSALRRSLYVERMRGKVANTTTKGRQNSANSDEFDFVRDVRSVSTKPGTNAVKLLVTVPVKCSCNLKTAGFWLSLCQLDGGFLQLLSLPNLQQLSFCSTPAPLTAIEMATATATVQIFVVVVPVDER